MAVTADAPANPFDADTPSSTFLVLVNDRGQYSLWPLFADVPEGWTTVYGPCSRTQALTWVTTCAVDPGALTPGALTR
ncbi:MbtH family NRPS accessory protein [Streptomyces sp. p1417]|uniref:MbtH family NRPS accessory protein n=1 Tax=Streptomyces typhae TaxID=2681492 RepID=A0A6L6WX50_9ACTN|nr:MbtH family protein [Streptomyces typhae]MVO85586.1 MbtH family NRPS accessory protein [Streptomyces typhae]